MAAIGEAQAQQLISDAEAVGLTVEQIAAHVRVRPHHLDNISGNDASKISAMISQRREQIADQREVEAMREYIIAHASHFGYSEERVRERVAASRPAQIRESYDRMRRELRRRGVDARTEAEKRSDAQRRAHAAQAPATERQIDYLTSLLVRRANTGEGGGFVGGVDALVDAGGKVDVAALRRLTRPQASRLIDSLRGSY